LRARGDDDAGAVGIVEETGDGPGGAGRSGDGRPRAMAAAGKPRQETAEHGRLAVEEMGAAGDVEPQTGAAAERVFAVEQLDGGRGRVARRPVGEAVEGRGIAGAVGRMDA